VMPGKRSARVGLNQIVIHFPRFPTRRLLDRESAMT
jgi:hypothetical protein